MEHGTDFIQLYELHFRLDKSPLLSDNYIFRPISSAHGLQNELALCSNNIVISMTYSTNKSPTDETAAFWSSNDFAACDNIVSVSFRRSFCDWDLPI